MRNFLRAGAIAALATVAIVCAATIGATPTLAQPATTTASGLQIIDTKVGSGASPKSGQTCVMHYTGWAL
jgi:peptidylprolyl isomerase